MIFSKYVFFSHFFYKDYQNQKLNRISKCYTVLVLIDMLSTIKKLNRKKRFFVHTYGKICHGQKTIIFNYLGQASKGHKLFNHFILSNTLGE